MLKHLRLFLPLAALLAACGPDSTQPSALIRTGGPVLELFDPAMVQPSSVDVRIDKFFRNHLPLRTSGVSAWPIMGRTPNKSK